MTEKQAYVVMLPLTDEQYAKAISAPLEKERGERTFDVSLRAIGTPVDSSVPVRGYVLDWATETVGGEGVSWDDARLVRSIPPVADGWVVRNVKPLIFQSEHFAALAEKQAEVERLRAALQPFSDAADTYDAEGNEYEREYPDEFAIDKDPEDEETGSGLKVAHLREARRVFEADEGAAS